MARYELVRRLGSGGMGTVFAAVQEGLDREVALKLLPREAADDPEVRARFHREMQLLSQISHPNVVRVFDWGELDGQLFFTMEQLTGHDLAKAPMEDFWRARPLLIQVADALAHLHARGIVHRDVKPSNLMCAEAGRVVLIDFGLSKVRGDAALTATGALVGTPCYLAPETVLGNAHAPASDVYALAATAYELVTGRRMIHEGTAAQTLAAVIASERPSLAEVPGLPPWFVELFARAVALEPQERPTAEEFRDVLERQGVRLETARVAASGGTRGQRKGAGTPPALKEAGAAPGLRAARPVLALTTGLLTLVAVLLPSAGSRTTMPEVSGSASTAGSRTRTSPEPAGEGPLHALWRRYDALAEEFAAITATVGRDPVAADVHARAARLAEELVALRKDASAARGKVLEVAPGDDAALADADALLFLAAYHEQFATHVRWEPVHMLHALPAGDLERFRRFATSAVAALRVAARAGAPVRRRDLDVLDDVRRVGDAWPTALLELPEPPAECRARAEAFRAELARLPGSPGMSLGETAALVWDASLATRTAEREALLREVAERRVQLERAGR